MSTTRFGPPVPGCVLAALFMLQTPAALAEDALQRLQLQSWHSSRFMHAASSDAGRERLQRVELRPDLLWQQGSWQLDLQPRLAADSRNDSSIWLNRGHVRWQSGQWSASAGRELLLWGPSLFWTLSNRLWPDNGRTEPHSELPGHGLLHVDYSADSRQLTQLLWQFDHGHAAGDDRRGPAREAQLLLLRQEISTDNGSGGLVVSQRRGQQLRVGAWGQYTASDALIVYADSDWGRREQAGLPGLPLQGHARLQALFGAGWTSADGLTLNGEYFYNGAAPDSEQLQLREQLWQAWPSAWRPALSDAGTTTLHRHQVALQLMNGGDADFKWIARLNHALQQDSGNAMLQLAWTPGENWQLWANALQHYGDAPDRDGGPVTRMFWLGLTIFLR